MVATTEVKFDKDLANKKVVITKHINAKPDAVWQAWTKKDILDKWWAPKPWRAETTKLELQDGGVWQYAMVGPDNERHYAKFQYTKVHGPKCIEGVDSFTDEKGFVNAELPQAHWKIEFRASGAGTDIKIVLTSKTENALEKLLEMGFEEGFAAGLTNLEEYLDNTL